MRGHPVGIRPRDPLDEALEPQPAQVVGGLGGRLAGLPEDGHLGAQGLVGQAADDAGERRDRAEQGYRPGVAEAQAWRPLAVVDTGQNHRLQGGEVGKAALALPDGGQEPAVCGGAEGAQRPPVVGVEGLWRAKSSALFTVVSGDVG